MPVPVRFPPAMFMLCLLTSIILSSCQRETDPLAAFAAGNYEISYKLWKQAAYSGNIAAQNYLGIHYYLGLGVRQDIGKALEWYQKAAEAGHHEAQNNLGMLYISDKLGNPDFEMAYVWLFAAYQQGNRHAHKGLESIAGQLSPNRVQILKQWALQYVKEDVIDPENDDY